MLGGALFVGVAGFVLLRPVDRSALDPVGEAREQLGIPLESSRIEGNGVYLNVVQAGPADGPPVVLLHGFPEFWWAWLHQMGDLAAAGFRVIAPDLRGYGGSDKPSAIAAYTTDQLADDITGLARNLGYEEVLLAGHDQGAAVAWNLAIRRPSLVGKLVVVNMGHPAAAAQLAHSATPPKSIGWYRTFFRIPHLPELLLPLADWSFPAWYLRTSMREGVLSGEDVEYYKAAWDGAIGTMMQWYRTGGSAGSSLPDAGRVDVPTLILWGMRDPFLDSRLAALSAEYCADARVEELPGAGHFVMQEDPDAVSELMIGFFSKPGS